MTIAQVLIDQHKYVRSRLLQTLAEIEKSDSSKEALHWMMPFGKGRANIAWQMMHCAATLDRYLNMRVLGKSEPADKALIESFASGSECKPGLSLTPDEIRAALEKSAQPYFEYFSALSDEQISQKANEAADRTQVEVLRLLNFHEAHHQGQCHIVWNSFKSK